MKKIMFIYREMRQKIFYFWRPFGFSGKAEPKLEGLMTKFHHLPLEKLCTKFGVFVRSINIKLKYDAKELINIHSGMVTKHVI